MADPVDSLEQKVEQAFAALLSDVGIEDLAQFLFGHDSELQDGTFIVFTCFGGPEFPFGSGNYQMRLRMTYYTPSDRDLAHEQTTEDPRQRHGNMVQKSREAIFTETIETDLSAQEDNFTVFIVVPQGPDSGYDGRFFWTYDEFIVDCANADL